jgi:hypothetical protein
MDMWLQKGKSTRLPHRWQNHLLADIPALLALLPSLLTFLKEFSIFMAQPSWPSPNSPALPSRPSRYLSFLLLPSMLCVLSSYLPAAQLLTFSRHSGGCGRYCSVYEDSTLNVARTTIVTRYLHGGIHLVIMSHDIPLPSCPCDKLFQPASPFASPQIRWLS